MVMNRLGVSPVVATVLLLVLTIVIGSIVFSVVLPFVDDKLGESKACLDVFEGVEFAESSFNCYNLTAPTVETGFSVKINKEKVEGVRIALIDSNENSDVVEIRQSSSNPGLRMVGSAVGAYNTPLTFPTAGGQRTYLASGTYKKAEIAPITDSGEICAVGDVIEFQLC